MSTAQQSGRKGSWRVNSLRLRILLAMLGWTLLGIAGIWYSATRLFAKHVELQYHEELEVHIRELSRLVVVRPDGSLRLDRPLSDPRYLVPLSGFYWQVTSPGRSALRSPSMTRGVLNEAVAHHTSVHHHVENGPTGPTITYGMLRKSPNGSEVHFAIATDERMLDETIASFTRELTTWLISLAIALLATGMLAVSVGLRPLARLSRATTRLRGGKADRVEGNYPKEIAPLVADLNAFIDHNRKIVERARVEAGNLAHALRTPLAVITDEAERMAGDMHSRETSRVLLEQAEVMVRQIEYQLARARSTAGARGPGRVGRIGEVLPPILSAMTRLHPERSFRADIAVGADPILPVDPVDLSELLSILIDNAGKWSLEAVRIETAIVGDMLQVVITDDGAGMTVDQIASAFDLGTRFDPSMPGFGLGLAIARDIATAYGIAIELRGRRDGARGLEVALSLPTVSSD